MITRIKVWVLQKITKIYLIGITPFIIATLLLISTLTFGEQKALLAKVLKISDGDTVVVSPVEGGDFIKCRLDGVDAPEVGKGSGSGQPYGEEAKRELKRLILSKLVNVVTVGKDRYRRDICRISSVDDMDINLEMIRRGYAWAFRKYLKKPYAKKYIDAEDDARKLKIGLWQDENPIPPWEYRHRKR